MTQRQNPCYQCNMRPKYPLKFMFRQRPVVLILCCCVIRVRTLSMGLERDATSYSRSFSSSRQTITRMFHARSHRLVLSGLPKRLNADNHKQIRGRFHQQSTVRSFGAFDQEGDRSTLDDTTASVSLEIPREQDTEEIGALFAALFLGNCFGDKSVDTGAHKTPEGATIFLDG